MAQTTPVRGRVVGPDGSPLAGQGVVLHRVDASTGVTVATGVSDSSGSFELDVPSADASGDGVFFLAARYTDGELYLGDAFRAPFDSAAQHVVRVGVPETSARNLVTGGEPPEDPAAWLLYALPLAAIVGFAAVHALRTGRIPARRRTLAEIARLDEHKVASDDASYRARRAELLARLGPPAGS
jgi:hypothetical protein